MDTLDILWNALLDTPFPATLALIVSAVVIALGVVLAALLLAQSRMEEWRALTSVDDEDGMEVLEALFAR